MQAIRENGWVVLGLSDSENGCARATLPQQISAHFMDVE
jgi:hypothetical protein